MKQLLIGTLICVFVFAACDAAVSGTLPVDDISGSNNDDPSINPTIDPPTIDPPTIDPPVDPWSFPVVTELWEPGEYTDDEGTTFTDAYPIDNWRQLEYISKEYMNIPDLTTHSYYLTDDITFPSRDDVPSEYTNDYYVVNGFTPIGTGVVGFIGNFDGQGFTIADVVIKPDPRLEQLWYAGFFGNIGTAFINYDITRIRNITFRNAHFVGPEAGGILAGGITRSSIERIFIDGGSVQGNFWVGAISASLRDSTLSHCGASASVSGNQIVGGLVGHTSGSVLENNYFLGTVSASTNKGGGIVGSLELNSTARTNYSRAKVTGGADVGGLFGSTNSSTLTNNFWDPSANSGTPPSGSYPSYGVGNPETDTNATPLTSPTAASFTGFTFGSTTEGWNTPADGEWPTLYWQEEN